MSKDGQFSVYGYTSFFTGSTGPGNFPESGEIDHITLLSGHGIQMRTLFNLYEYTGKHYIKT